MITFFPSFYPDELLYSRLARYYQKSGLIAYIYAAEELLANPHDRPDFEFLNVYTPSAISLMTNEISMGEIVMRHTMFPYFARFLPMERRKRAYQAMRNMQRDYHNHIAYPKSKDGLSRFARYCPLCAEADRQTYGETYWHRQHQIIGVDICPVHHCTLIKSNFSISSRTSPSLITAEESIDENSEVVLCGNFVEIQLAEYIASVFSAPLMLDNDVDVGAFLHSKMTGTSYLSIRGRKRDMVTLHRDFCIFYDGLPQNWFTEMWQLQKLLNGYRTNMYEVCLMAMFLHIPSSELTYMTLPAVSAERAYDEQIISMHKQGMNYREISKAVGGGYDTVKAIGEGRYGGNHVHSDVHRKSGVKGRNWNQIDEDTLPMVKRVIADMVSDIVNRPVRINAAAVMRALGLPKKFIDNLPQCKAYIRTHTENQQEYWAREIVWAYCSISSSGKAVNRTAVCALINLRKQDFQSSLPYLQKYTDETTATIIISL